MMQDDARQCKMMQEVLGILGPGQLGPAGHLGPGAQLSTFSRRTVGPRMNHIFQDMHIYVCACPNWPALVSIIVLDMPLSGYFAIQCKNYTTQKTPV